MATNVVTGEWRLQAARQFIESIDEASNTAWYVWFGDHVTVGAPGDVYDMVLDTSVRAYRNMIMGKRVANTDVSVMVRRIEWESGKVYTMYDPGDPIMQRKDYFVITTAGSYSHVFKCLDNNHGANSTVEPNFADVDATDAVYQTSDGYRWKYMYSVDDTTVDRFATSSYFPLVANSSVVDAAVPGSIDVIRIYDTGEGYRNYLTGTFDGGHVRVDGNSLIYAVSSNTAASQLGGFYTGCVLYISAGNGTGQFREIVDYFSNSSGKFIKIETPFDINPTNASEFEIYPLVRIRSSGDETITAGARALVNAVGNSVYRVEMLDRGRDYSYALASVVANDVVGVIRPANVIPVFSPPGGHGADAAAELGAERVSVSVKLSNSESNTIPVTNGFRQIGMLRDPAWSNVSLTIDGIAGSFYVNEDVKRFTKIELEDDSTAIEDDVFVSSTDGDWDRKVSDGDELILDAGLNHQLVRVVNVPNSTHIQVNSALTFSCTEVTVSLAKIDRLTASVVEQPNATCLIVDLSDGVLGNGDSLIGRSSGATANISSIARGGVTKGFETFVECWKYRGSYVSGTFAEDERVYQGDSLSEATATADLHSAADDNGLVTVLTSNQFGVFDASLQLKGASSGGVFTISDKYPPEVKYGSGRVTYIQNISPVARRPGQSESVKLLLEF